MGEGSVTNWIAESVETKLAHAKVFPNYHIFQPEWEEEKNLILENPENILRKDTHHQV